MKSHSARPAVIQANRNWKSNWTPLDQCVIHNNFMSPLNGFRGESGMDDDGPSTWFLFRCDRCIPRKPMGSFLSAPLIDWLGSAALLPCWACASRIVLDVPLSENPHSGHFFICVGCGRHWLIERGGNPETLVIRVSVPGWESGRAWTWSRRRETSDEAWDRYVEDMLRIGEEPVLRLQWEKQQ